VQRPQKAFKKGSDTTIRIVIAVAAVDAIDVAVHEPLSALAIRPEKATVVVDKASVLNAGVHPNFVMAIEVYVQMLRAQASVTFRMATLIRYRDIDTATPAGHHADAIATVSLNFDNMVIVNC